MKKLLLTLAVLVVFGHVGHAGQLMKVWDRTFGGSGSDRLKALGSTPDGGYILGGYSYSDAGADKTEDSKGQGDYWIVRIDSDGNKIWDRTFGGSGSDVLQTLQPTPDGGYMLGGFSRSDAGADKTEDSRGEDDYWIVRIDAEGNKLWDRTFGGSGRDYLHALQPTPDGGYILGGYSESDASGDKTEDSKGERDYWIVRIDAEGNKIWDRTFGGSHWDRLEALHSTPDGGYILGGYSESDAGEDKTEDSRGGYDYWIVRIDADGNKIWDRTFGGSDGDWCSALQATPDGGFTFGGESRSDAGGDKTEDSRGGDDYWIVKTDGDGNKLWDRTFGGSDGDSCSALQTTPHGGFIFGGESSSGAGGDKTEDSRGSDDYWIICTAFDSDSDGMYDAWEIEYSFDVFDPADASDDADSDGLTNYQECVLTRTSPRDSDSDDDGVSDLAEFDVHHTDPNDPDSDQDGLNDGEEIQWGADPNASDTDSDGLNDPDEVNIHHTNPALADSDGDGLSDPDEINVYSTDPNDPDSDKDGLSDHYEPSFYATDPNNPDTDSDGLPDKWEIAQGFSPIVANAFDDADLDGMPDQWETDNGLDPEVPNAAADTDSDGLADPDEFQSGTDPNDPDTDSDGIPDGWEVTAGLNPLRDDAAENPDGDSLPNAEEYIADLNPLADNGFVQIVLLTPGWNLVGAGDDFPIPGSRDTVTETVWGWDGDAYFIAQEECPSAVWHLPGYFIKNHGYWIYAPEEAVLVLQNQ